LKREYLLPCQEKRALGESKPDTTIHEYSGAYYLSKLSHVQTKYNFNSKLEKILAITITLILDSIELQNKLIFTNNTLLNIRAGGRPNIRQPAHASNAIRETGDTKENRHIIYAHF
jgi:hypothetical protein